MRLTEFDTPNDRSMTFYEDNSRICPPGKTV